MKHLILAFALALAGCAGIPGAGTPEQAQRTAFAAKSAYVVALEEAVKYKRRPACPAVQPCADPAIVAQLQKADTVAAAAVDAAESAARTATVGATARDRAIQAASAALAAFSALLSTGALQ